MTDLTSRKGRHTTILATLATRCLRAADARSKSTDTVSVVPNSLYTAPKPEEDYSDH